MNLLHLGNKVFKKDCIEKVIFGKQSFKLNKNQYIEAFYFEEKINGEIDLRTVHCTKPVTTHDSQKIISVSNFCGVDNKQGLYDAIKNNIDDYFDFDFDNDRDLFQNKLFVAENNSRVYSILTNVQLFNNAEITMISGNKSVFHTKKEVKEVQKEFSKFKIQ